MNVLSCGPKASNNFGRHFPALHLQKSSRHVRECAAGDGAICSKNRKIVPHHGDNPNTRNGVRLRSPCPIMAPNLIHSTFLSLKIVVDTCQE